MRNEINNSCLRANADLFEHSKVINILNDKHCLKVIDFDSEYSLNGGLIVGNFVDKNGKRVGVVSDPGHTLVVGSTGSGKTESFYIPQLEAIGKSKDNVSFLVMDMKGQMYKDKAKFLEKHGYKVYVINGKEPAKSVKYNPLDIVYRAYKKATIAKEILKKGINAEELYFNGKNYTDKDEYIYDIEVFIHEQTEIYTSNLDSIVEVLVPLETGRDLTWDYGAREIVKFTIIAMLEDTIVKDCNMDEDMFTLFNVHNVISSRENDCEHLIDYIKAHGFESDAKFILNYLDSKSKVTRDSFIMTTTSKLDRIIDLTMRTMTSASELNLESILNNIGKEKVAIFCIADSTNKAAYAVCNMILLQTIATLQRIGDSEYRGDFHIFADEFCNMVKMERITDWITTMRSRHVWFHLGIQSYSQMDERYDGPATRITIQGNSKTVFLGSNDYKTNEEFAKSFGECIGTTKSYNIDCNGNYSLNINTMNFPTVKISDISDMKLGDAYIKMFGNYGNLALKSHLDPDFMIDTFAHDKLPSILSNTKIKTNIKRYNIYRITSAVEMFYKPNKTRLLNISKEEREYFNKLFSNKDVDVCASIIDDGETKKNIISKILANFDKLAKEDKVNLGLFITSNEYWEFIEFLEEATDFCNDAKIRAKNISLIRLLIRVGIIKSARSSNGMFTEQEYISLISKDEYFEIASALIFK